MGSATCVCDPVAFCKLDRSFRLFEVLGGHYLHSGACLRQRDQAIVSNIGTDAGRVVYLAPMTRFGLCDALDSRSRLEPAVGMPFDTIKREVKGLVPCNLMREPLPCGSHVIVGHEGIVR